MDFVTRNISSWSEFVELIASQQQDGSWVYRGQSQDWPLATSLERALSSWGISLDRAPLIEKQLVRGFRRQYSQNDRDEVDSDTLYCLALMQHHGAPTRLLDFTYSPYIATKFAVDRIGCKAVVWCINSNWIYSIVRNIIGEDLFSKRNADKLRNDQSFLSAYLRDSDNYSFANLENPVRLSERLVIQQGVFLCPSNISRSIERNLKTMKGWDSELNILKILFTVTPDEAKNIASVLRRMNLSSAALFPGLDGFARSLRENLLIYDALPDAGIAPDA